MSRILTRGNLRSGPMDAQHKRLIKRARNARTYSQVVRKRCRDDELRRELGWAEPQAAAFLAVLHAYDQAKAPPRSRFRLVHGGLADDTRPAA